MFSRNTYVKINLNNLKDNIESIIKNYSDYQYYFGVVKADFYGHSDLCLPTVLESGINYLAVATLEEAISLRNKNREIPILCLGIIDLEYIDQCIKNNITITIPHLDYAKLLPSNTNLKVHIKINTGMNRLGIDSINELEEVYYLLKEKGYYIEGIYSHIYCASDTDKTNDQISIFEEMVTSIKDNIPIVHLFASEALVRYPKPSFINGCRLGIIMYGFISREDLRLKSTYQLISEVIQIHRVQAGDTVGYDAKYKAEKDCYIAVVPIGYDDGLIRKNTGRDVYINDKRYPIIGNICMDMMFILVDETIKIHDKVYILKDNQHIQQIAKYLDTIPYEIICNIGSRVPRIIEKERTIK